MKKTTAQQNHGFTLLELIVAMVILTMTMALSFQAFSGTIRGWKRGTRVMENIKHGQFAMLQLANALNSTVYFNNPRQSYGFIFEKNGGNSADYPADIISFVTASSAFVPYGHPLTRGPHRLKLYIDKSDNGEDALFAEIRPIVADEDKYKADPILVTTGIQGIECTFYDEEQDSWTDEWTHKNSIPKRIKVALYAPPNKDEKADDGVVFTRIFEIPVAASVPAQLKGPSQSSQ
jgi:prepilin-type N-terminal cleavage/methylation domain-containing protein